MGFLGEFRKNGGSSTKSIFLLEKKLLIIYFYKTSHLLSVIQKVPKNKE